MKKSLVVLLCLLLALYSSIAVFAHPGGTDGSGGHTDRDTGEYHYHHGYPAHDHYDMDGDGVVDCPYDFDDQTGHNSGSSGNNSSGTSWDDSFLNTDYWDSWSNAGYIYRDERFESTPAVTTPTDTESEVKAVPVWVYWIIAFLSVSTLFLFLSNKYKREENRNLESRYCNDLDALKEKHAKELELLQSDFTKELNERISQFVSLHSEERSQMCSRINDLSAQNKKSHFNNQLLLQKLLAQSRQFGVLQTEADLPENQSDSTQKQLMIAKAQLVQEKSAVARLIAENAELQSKINELSCALDELKSNHNSNQSPPLPDGVYFINGSIPVKGTISERKPFGDYTVYISKRGKCYHADRYCGSGFLEAAHLFDVVNKKPPCQKCVFGQKATIPEWYDQLDFLTPDSR